MEKFTHDEKVEALELIKGRFVDKGILDDEDFDFLLAEASKGVSLNSFRAKLVGLTPKEAHSSLEVKLSARFSPELIVMLAPSFNTFVMVEVIAEDGQIKLEEKANEEGQLFVKDGLFPPPDAFVGEPVRIIDEDEEADEEAYDEAEDFDEGFIEEGA